MATSAPRIIYLDLAHWYALGEAMAGHPQQPVHMDILRGLTVQVESGHLLFPLSAVHYMEVAENPRDHHRREVAAAMRTVSRYVTIAPIGKIVDEEMAKELNRRFGRPAFPIKVPKFGVGVGFAFGEPGRFTLTGFTEQQRPEIEARLGMTIAELEAEANAFAEDALLGEPAAMRAQLPGFDP